MGDIWRENFQEHTLPLASNAAESVKEGVKTEKDFIEEETQLSDLPSQLAIPRELYELPKTSIDEIMKSPKNLKFALPKGVGEYGMDKDTQRALDRLRDLKLIGDHFEGAGYEEPMPVFGTPGIPNSEIFNENYELFLHNTKQIKRDIADVFFKKYDYLVKKASGEIESWAKLNAMPENEKELNEALQKAMEYVATHHSGEEPKLFAHILSEIDKAEREILAYRKKKYEVIIEEAKRYYEDKVKEAVGLAPDEDFFAQKIAAIAYDLKKLEIPKDSANLIDSLQELKKMADKASEKEFIDRIVNDLELLRKKMAQQGKDMPLSYESFMQMGDAVLGARGISRDVTASSQIASMLAQTALRNSNYNAIDIVTGLGEYPNLSDEDRKIAEDAKKDFLLHLDEAIEELYKKNEAKLLDMDKESFRSLMHEEIPKIVKSEAQPLLEEFWNPKDETKKVSPFTNDLHTTNIEVATNALKDAMTLATLKATNEEFAKRLEAKGATKEIMLKNLSKNLFRERPDKNKINDIMNVHNLLYRIDNGSIGEYETKALLDSPVFNNSNIIKGKYKDVFKEFTTDYARNRINYSNDIYEDVLPSEETQQQIAEQGYISLYNTLFQNKSMARKLASHIMVGQEILDLSECMKKGSVKLSPYHTPAQNLSDCFKQFAEGIDKNTKERFKTLANASSNPVVAFNPFFIIAILAYIYARYKSEVMRLEWERTMQKIVSDSYYINSAFTPKEQQARMAVVTSVNGTDTEGHYYQTTVKAGHEEDFKKEINKEAIIYGIANNMDDSLYFAPHKELYELIEQRSKEDQEIAKEVAKAKEELLLIEDELADYYAKMNELERIEKEIERISVKIDNNEAGALDKLTLISLQSKKKNVLASIDTPRSQELLARAESLNKHINALKEKVDAGALMQHYAKEGMPIKYEEMNKDELLFTLRLYQARNEIVVDDMINGAINKNAATAEIERNQRIINRLHKELLAKDDIRNSIDYIASGNERLERYLGINREAKQRLAQYLKNGDYEGALHYIKEDATIPEDVKRDIVYEVEFAAEVPSLIEQMEKGNFTNVAALKKHFEKFIDIAGDAYDVMEETNSIYVNLVDRNRGDEVGVEVHQGINSYVNYLYDKAAEEMQEELVEKLSSFIENDEVLKDLKVSKHTIDSMIDRVDKKSTRKQIGDLRRNYRRAIKV